MTLILALGLLFLTTALIAAWAVSVHTPDDTRVNPDTLQRIRDGRLR